MADHSDDRPDYNPAEPTPPAREPPLRSTAPQGPFTLGQVGAGFVVLVIGLLVVFGVPLLLT